MKQHKQSGVIQFIPLIVVAALIAGLLIATLNIGNITNFLNRAAENFAISSPPLISPGPSTSPASLEDWQTCVTTPGAKILQTYPGICVYPDGRRITEPTSVPQGPTLQTETALPNTAPGSPPQSNEIPTFPPSTPTPRPTARPTTTPIPTCAPMPPCVNANPRCLIPEPAGGWCPATPTPFGAPTPTPFVYISPIPISQIPQAAPATVQTIFSTIINSVTNFLQGLFAK